MRGFGARIRAEIRKGRGSETGQSTIEFALSMIFVMTFVVGFLQLSMVFAFGNYAHYATFMAARAYLSSGPDRQDQMDRARSVIVRTLKGGAGQPDMDRFPMIAKGTGDGDPAGLTIDGPQFAAGDRNFSWMQGIRYTFRSRIFLIPLGSAVSRGPATGGNSPNSLQLTSESWLGREATNGECTTDMAKSGWYFDNGC